MIELDSFVQDSPWEDNGEALTQLSIENQIEGVVLRKLISRGDKRGQLTVLMSRRHGETPVAPHVYLVEATGGSLRAWVYHKKQHDRLAFTNGHFRVALWDLRPDSKTYKQLNVLDVGADNKVQIEIPPLVVHAVQNRGEYASFINMPSLAYDESDPDKFRLVAGTSGLPDVF